MYGCSWLMIDVPGIGDASTVISEFVIMYDVLGGIYGMCL